MVDTVMYCMNCCKLIRDQAPRWLLFLPRRLDSFSIPPCVKWNLKKYWAHICQGPMELDTTTPSIVIGKHLVWCRQIWKQSIVIGKLVNYLVPKEFICSQFTLYMYRSGFSRRIGTLERYVGAKLAMSIQDCLVFAMCSVQGGCNSAVW